MKTGKLKFDALSKRVRLKYLHMMSVLMLLLLVGQPCLAGVLTPLEVAAKLQETYNQTTTMTADFQQVTSSAMSSRKRQGAGTLVLAKPGHMRWDYLEPDPQVFVCDGTTILMYFAKENQMVVTPAKQYLEADVTYSFFAGTGDILRDFTISVTEEPEEDLTSFQLRIVPKNVHPQVDFIDLWADRESFLIKRLKITDKFGSVTDLIFSNTIRNKEVSDKLFTFTPPAGTEIIKQ